MYLSHVCVFCLLMLLNDHQITTFAHNYPKIHLIHFFIFSCQDYQNIQIKTPKFQIFARIEKLILDNN